MENKEIGRFYAKTFNNQYYEFIIKEDGYIYWDLLKDQKIKKMIIKPKFELFMVDGSHRILNNKTESDLIEVYSINTELLQYLLEKKIVMYSTDMAHLYNFENKNGYDTRCQKRSFKRVKDKEKIFSKQKKGIFN